MAYIIKENEPRFEDTCKMCNTTFGFNNIDIITRPSFRYPNSVMDEYVKCPKCNKLTLVGWYYKSIYEKGNYERLTQESDWD